MTAKTTTTPLVSSTTTISTTKSSGGLTSARGLLALLEEPLDALKIHGLRCLNDCAMTTQWAEVAASLDVIESMHEDELFSRRDLAALVASKVGCLRRRRSIVRRLSVRVRFAERLILERDLWISFFFRLLSPTLNKTLKDFQKRREKKMNDNNLRILMTVSTRTENDAHTHAQPTLTLKCSFFFFMSF